MKKKLQLPAVVLLVSLSFLAGSALLQVNTYVILTLSVISICATLLFFIFWMRFVAHIVSLSASVLSQKNQKASVFSWNNADVLLRNCELIDGTIKQAANKIRNLSDVTSASRADDLKDGNDLIGDALQKVRMEMWALKEEEDQRKWITQGLANFSEVLRNKKELKEYAAGIVSHLVRYLRANQGSLYITGEDEQGARYLELMSCYAFDKRKVIEQRIAEGQGILGQCMLEHEFVYLKDIPDNYIKITSGLGEATPRNLIIMPLIFNDQFYGAIEMAFFHEVREHEIEFLKEVSTSIASEIAAIKTIDKTKELLEQSNILTEELQTREEEMKQNLEELAATQEEMVRKQAELAGVLRAIDATLATAEFDINGKLTSYNNIFEKIFGYTAKQLDSKDYRILLAESEYSFQHIVSGRVKEGDFHSKDSDGKPLWLRVTFTVVHTSTGEVAKVLTLLQDVTDKKNQEQEFERLSLVANNTDNAVIITNADGLTEYVNEGFSKMTGYHASEIIGKKPGTLLQGPDTDQETIQRIRKKLAEKKPIYEEILNYNKKGDSYWVSIAINPVFNKRGNVDRFISIQADITKTKEAALDFRYKLEAISRSNAVIEFDPRGFILDANDNFLNLTHYKLSEIKGKHHQIFLNGTDIPAEQHAVYWNRIASGEFVCDECQCATRQGKIIWLKGVYNPILDVHGKLKKVIKFSVDITEEKRLQQVADKKQKELNSYLEGINNTIASAEFSPQGKFVTANDIFMKVMGYSEVEVKGRDVTFFMGDDPATVMMWENLRLGKFFSGEFKMKNKVGKDLWLVGTFNPIIINNRLPEKIMMFAQFTTQEKEKVNDLNAIVQTVKYAIPVLELNDQFYCKTANDKFTRLFGVSRLELRSKSILDFIDPVYHANWKQRQLEVLGADFITLNLPIRYGNNTVMYEVSLSIARNLEGDVSKVIMLFVREVVERIPVLAVG